MLKGKKGFTLIELMIVVAIIGILAAIAIPNFLKFQAKSKQSEAKTNLKGIYTAQTGYFGENNAYSGFPTVNWQPVGTARYHYTLAANSSGGPSSLEEGLVTQPAGTGAANWVHPTLGTFTPAIVATSFTAGAVGNVDSDPVTDCWIITDGNTLVNTQNDV
jgi:type IV pilus assembly protein PilA